jgi:DNA-binding response OmpR family regulator
MENARRILVVDEDRDFLDGCHRTFGDSSYRLESVSSQQQAQQTISGDYDLIIIGSLTPAGESFTLQQWIKRHPAYQHIPVLVVDACFHERRWKGWRVFEGLQMDAEEYISKPMEPAELLPVIERLCSNIVSDQRTVLETLWQAYLSLDQGDRDVFSRRIVEQNQ